MSDARLPSPPSVTRTGTSPAFDAAPVRANSYEEGAAIPARWAPLRRGRAPSRATRRTGLNGAAAPPSLLTLSPSEGERTVAIPVHGVGS